MALRCPVCKAENAAGPACRRCKADLTLVFALEEQRGCALAEARLHLRERSFRAAQAAAMRADQLRRDEVSRGLVALTALLCRDHALAWRTWRRA